MMMAPCRDSGEGQWGGAGRSAAGRREQRGRQAGGRAGAHAARQAGRAPAGAGRARLHVGRHVLEDRSQPEQDQHDGEASDHLGQRRARAAGVREAGARRGGGVVTAALPGAGRPAGRGGQALGSSPARGTRGELRPALHPRPRAYSPHGVVDGGAGEGAGGGVAAHGGGAGWIKAARSGARHAGRGSGQAAGRISGLQSLPPRGWHRRTALRRARPRRRPRGSRLGRLTR